MFWRMFIRIDILELVFHHSLFVSTLQMYHLWIPIFCNKHIGVENLICARWQLATNIALRSLQQAPTSYKWWYIISLPQRY